MERHKHAVFNLALRLLRDPAGAEDVAQDTFVKVFRRLDTYDATRRFVPWLLRIAHNTAIDSLRRAHAPWARLDDNHIDLATATPGPAARLERLEARDAVATALDRLRPEYRAAITLRYQEELSYAEVAQVMGVPEGTAKTYVRRARRELAGILAADGWGAPDS